MAPMPFAGLHVYQSWVTLQLLYQSKYSTFIIVCSEPGRHLNTRTLAGWLSARQKAPDSGFAGRTNKLVDGCYSHWVGGCWSLLAASLQPGPSPHPDLFSHEALARYVLGCAQELRKAGEKPTSRKGGFKDKPSKPVDAYHSHYNLAGLGAAQFAPEYVPSSNGLGAAPLTEAFNWKVARVADGPWEEEDLIKPVHPVFVVQVDKALACRKYFEEHSSF
jgi:protein farnesyltransferase subunit beta